MTRNTIPTLFTFCALFACALAPAEATPITIDTVPVGNAGNAPDQVWPSFNPTNLQFGAVAYNYRIGTTGVTNAQYTAFLNAVAATDTYFLYHTSMNSNTHGGITRSGTSGSFTYATKPGMENKPVNYVSWGDATRFANWLHNGQPTGAQDATTTEDGAYTLNGASTNAELNAVTRNAGAKWWLPSEDEWYKAAFHKNDGLTGNYWDYPTSSDTAPTAEPPPGGTNSANITHAVGTVTDVGAYFDSASPYGTFDQAGNVWEWNEAFIDGSFRGLRGGSWDSFAFSLTASNRNIGTPTSGNNIIGFRVATVPEPSTAVLGMIGFALTLWWRRRRK